MRRPSLPASAPVVSTCAAVAALVASLGVIGADALWLVPLGGEVAHGRVPSSIPYATARTSGWHDVPAGAELVFWAAYHAFGGDRGLVLLQAAAAALGIGALARGLARQSSPGGALAVSLLVIVGSLPAIAVTNVSLFSLALFPLLLGLLEIESEAATGRIWLAVPLLGVWGNLHGAVLVGWALLACHLVFRRGRRRPFESLFVFASATLALFANAALWHTPDYYRGVFENEAAKQGVGLWTPLGTSGFDVLLVVVAAVLVALWLRARRVRLWEAVAVLGLAAATVEVARNGVWLLLVAAYPAARSLSLPGPRPRLAALVAGAVGAGAVAAVVQAPTDPASHAVAKLAARSGGPVLAEPVLGQQVAVAGGRTWVDNPIDAFSRADQRLYVDWFSGNRGGARAVARARLVLVRAGSDAQRAAARDRRLVLLTAKDGAALYRVRTASGD